MKLVAWNSCYHRVLKIKQHRLTVCSSDAIKANKKCSGSQEIRTVDRTPSASRRMIDRASMKASLTSVNTLASEVVRLLRSLKAELNGETSDPAGSGITSSGEGLIPKKARANDKDDFTSLAS